MKAAAGLLFAALLTVPTGARAESVRSRGEATFSAPGGVLCQVRIGARDNLTCARRSDGLSVNCYEQVQCTKVSTSKYWGKSEQADFFREESQYPVKALTSGDKFDDGSSLCSILPSGVRCVEMDGSTFTLTAKGVTLTKKTHPPRLRWS